MVVRILGALLAVVVAGCATTPSQAPASEPAAPAADAQAQPQSRLAFVDVESFDGRLGNSLAGALPRVDVEFYDRITPSQLPVRLQRWLSSVENGGGKISVTPPPGSLTARSPMLLVSLVTSLWSGQKFAKEMSQVAELRSARNYDAEVLLKNDGRGDVTVDRVVFTPRAK